MADFISNSVTALNDAAKDFTRKHVVDEEGNFCFSKLVPVPDILTKTGGIPRHKAASSEELQAFKDAHPKTVHCEYEQEGLLYSLSKFGSVEASICTKAGHKRLIKLYGCDNAFDYCIKFWGSGDEISDCETEDEDDTLSYDFSTAWDLPWQFMRKLTTACPEGKWEWCCDAEGYFDWLEIELHQGKVIITKHCLPDDILELWQDIYGDEDFNLNQVCKWDDFGDTLKQYDEDSYLETELDPEDEVYQVELYQEVVIADYSRMVNWINNNVTALNDAAKDFTRKHVVDEEGNFCFSKLVPVPDILTKTGIPRHIAASSEELQAFKDAHPKTVHCEYEQEGLLYSLSKFGYVEAAICTKAGHKRLIELYGCDNDLDYRIQFWGCKNEISDCKTEDEDDTLSYDFRTAWYLPWQFMRKLTTACPEGKWEWCCDDEGYFDWLKIELHQGKVIITKHCLPDDILELWQDIYGDEDFNLNQVCKWDDFGLKQYNKDSYLKTELDPEDEVYQVELYQEVVIADYSRMANRINNNVTALNDAAKDFTRKHVVDEEGNFCFGKLVPVPDILAKIEDMYPRPIVSPEELQAFKAKHQQATHCEFEQEGLLYILDEDGELERSVYTEACNEHVIEQYGCDNYLDYRIKVWGCKNEIGDCETEDEDDTLSYDFSTAWDAPMAFMLKLAAACPEGQWQWRCEAEFGDWLVFELNQGEVILTEHGIDEEYVESVDDIYWNDRGEVLGVNDMENDTALIPGKVFSVNPNYKVALDN